jgi:hypothetical protein
MNISSNQSYKIIEVTDKNLLNNFINFPYALYPKNSCWVPPLLLEQKEFYNPKKNPFYNHSKVKLFLCYKNNKIAGRISAIINYNFNKYHNTDKIGFWGSFETINDNNVVKLLFNKIKVFFHEHNINIIRGPFTFSTNEISGLLIDNFDKYPSFMMPYNFDYYENLLLDNGHKKAKDLYAYFIPADVYKKIFEYDISKFIKKYKLKSKVIDFKNVKYEIKNIHKIYNEAWADNWGFIPMDENEFDKMGKELKMLLKPEDILFTYSDNELAGFIFAIPDLNVILNKINGKLLPTGIFKLLFGINKIHQSRVMTMGVKKKFRRRAVDIQMIQKMIQLKGRQYSVGSELSWILEDNFLMKKILEKMGAYISKTYRVFEKEI